MECKKCHRDFLDLQGGLCAGCHRVVMAMRDVDPVMLHEYMTAETLGPLGLAEAARMLGMSVSGLRKMCSRRAIRYRQSKPHAPIYFEREWVAEYIERRSIKPPARAVRSAREPIPDNSAGRLTTRDLRRPLLSVIGSVSREPSKCLASSLLCAETFLKSRDDAREGYPDCPSKGPQLDYVKPAFPSLALAHERLCLAEFFR
jgi:hypothetical protein